jgi:hypothetical protein
MNFGSVYKFYVNFNQINKIEKGRTVPSLNWAHGRCACRPAAFLAWPSCGPNGQNRRVPTERAWRRRHAVTARLSSAAARLSPARRWMRSILVSGSSVYGTRGTYRATSRWRRKGTAAAFRQLWCSEAHRW